MKDGLFRLAMRITQNAQDAEDVVQETMLKLWNQRDRWGEIDSIEAWAFTLAKNMALDSLRNNSKRQTEELTFDIPAAETDRFSARERVELVRKMIDSLPEKQRIAIQLRDFEEKSYREIADIMQISEEQVKVNIFRARTKLREQLVNID